MRPSALALAARSFDGAFPSASALRQQIADVLGLTIETVSRQFTRLKDEGVIALPSRRDVEILDPDALAAEAG